MPPATSSSAGTSACCPRAAILADRIEREGRWRDIYRVDRERRYRFSDGFACLFEHPSFDAEEFEALQRWCFEEEFRRLGPSVVRYAEVWQAGLEHLSQRAEPALRRRAEQLHRLLAPVAGLLPLARALAPSAAVRARVRQLQARLAPPPTLRQRVQNRVVSAAAFSMAALTAARLRVDALQHPAVTRHDWGGRDHPPVARLQRAATAATGAHSYAVRAAANNQRCAQSDKPGSLDPC